MTVAFEQALNAQQERNQALIQNSLYMRDQVVSKVLPFQIDIGRTESLSAEQINALQALEIEAARISIKSLASLAKIGELDHLGGGLELIPGLMLTLAVSDYEKIHYTIEHAHTSIGYYASLAATGFLDPKIVIDGFRRGLDIPGHVSWVPGGTQLNGGRLGVMIPLAVGQALGVKANKGEGAWVITHCGDAGWISGQALNGFNGADLHGAPVTFIMHRNGIQLSGTNRQIMDKDPRPIIESQGIQILEIPTLLDTQALYRAYREAFALAQKGRPSLIYPTGFKSGNGTKVDLIAFGNKYGILKEVQDYAGKHNVAMNTEVWIPGSLMSYRDVVCQIQCVFLVNELEGGEGHHDGHMKGRDAEEVLNNPMMQLNAQQQAALKNLRSRPKKEVITKARPAPGSANLVLSDAALAEVKLPGVGKKTSARAGVQEGYAAVAKAYPDQVFVVSCDLDPSTKLGKAREYLKRDHQFEMSIEEQVATMMADGLAFSSDGPQLNVVSTFSAFFEGLAREGLELWRYQRNLNGVNEGLNVTLHLSHVGSCTGRDHFSGWSLDWINLGLGYAPYIHRFYTPCDAGAAFVAIRDLAAHYGGHIIAIPRDNLPVLAKQDSGEALFDVRTPFEPVTTFRTTAGAKRAILAVGATAFLAEEAVTALKDQGIATDAYIINGFPFAQDTLANLYRKYPNGLVTIEDGIIGCPLSGIRGFAGVVRGSAYGKNIPLAHLGIIDPRIAPSEGHTEVWEHFGLSTEAVVNAVKSL